MKSLKLYFALEILYSYSCYLIRHPYSIIRQPLMDKWKPDRQKKQHTACIIHPTASVHRKTHSGHGQPGHVHNPAAAAAFDCTSVQRDTHILHLPTSKHCLQGTINKTLLKFLSFSVREKPRLTVVPNPRSSNLWI